MISIVCRGSAISKIIGVNAAANPEFHNRVNMFVKEETVNGRNLSEIINEKHENVKYLPGHRLPDNIVSFPIKILGKGSPQ